MKILHINSYFNGSVFYKNLYDHQVKNNTAIDVFVPLSTLHLEQNFDYGFYTKLSKNHHKFDRYFFYLKHSKIYKDIDKEYNINDFSMIHAHSLFSNGYIAMKLKEKYGVPYIVAVRNTDINIFFKKMFFLRRLGIKILKNADKVIFLSESYKDSLLKNYLPKNLRHFISNKVSIIPNGIDEFWFENIGSKKNLDKNVDLRLLFIGNINKNKNIISTIEAIKILQKKGNYPKLTIVGKIEDKSIYKNIIANNFVEYIEPKTKEDLLKIYRKNDIFVMPSIHESFGLVYAEAISQGLPVIYTRGQGFDKQFEEGLVGYSVDCKNFYEIAERIEKIVTDYATLSNNCVENIEKFKWCNISDEYNSLYQNIINGEIKHE